jgi:hypothetical protein
MRRFPEFQRFLVSGIQRRGPYRDPSREKEDLGGN